MVHLRAVSYDDFMDADAPEITVRQSVQDFVAAIRESSLQLADASAEFARDAMQAMDGARRQTEEAAQSGTEMAQVAQTAAEEARRLVDEMKSASEAVQQTVQTEKIALHDQAQTEKTALEEQTRQHTERLQDQSKEQSARFQERIEEAIARLDSSMEHHRETFEHGLAAMEATEAVASRVQDSVTEVAEAAKTAQNAAQKAQQATEQSETYLSSALTAVTTARELASGVVPPADGVPVGADGGTDTRELLGRLEDDYSRLTTLVQKLHERITSLSNPSFIPETAPDDTAATTVALAEDDAAEERQETPAIDYGEPAAADAPTAGPATSAYEDRFELRIAPVQSFDRLLALDAALTSLDFVTSVTLGDYEQDQVTFRVEINGIVNADDLARELGARIGGSIELLSAEAACITLRTA